MRTRIERVLEHLAKILQGDSEVSIQKLRAVIKKHSQSATFNEERVVREIQKLQSRGSLTVQDIDYLAKKIEDEMLP